MGDLYDIPRRTSLIRGQRPLLSPQFPKETQASVSLEKDCASVTVSRSNSKTTLHIIVTCSTTFGIVWLIASSSNYQSINFLQPFLGLQSHTMKK